MSESRIKQRAHAEILAGNPSCIYCTNPASTVEHMPPISVFVRRQRLKGLEFPCCQACNEGTRHADMVAAVLSRAWANPSSPVDLPEMSRLLRSVGTNIPGLLQEMQIGQGGQKLAARRTGLKGNFLRIGGPILTHYMTTFAAKLGFALFHEAHGFPVPLGLVDKA